AGKVGHVLLLWRDAARREVGLQVLRALGLDRRGLAAQDVGQPRDFVEDRLGAVARVVELDQTFSDLLNGHPLDDVLDAALVDPSLPIMNWNQTVLGALVVLLLK